MPQNIAPSYSDLDLNFIALPVTGDIKPLTDTQAIIRAVMNLVQTNHYESPFHPEIGSSVMKQLFEPATPLTAAFLQRSISDVIKNFEPRVDPATLTVTVTWSPGDKAFTVVINFFIVNQALPVTATFLLKRPR